MIRVKVSSKNQIAVPSEARRRLNLRPGDFLTVEVHDNQLILRPEPRNHTAHLLGLYSDIWSNVDPDDYIAAERDRWRS